MNVSHARSSWRLSVRARCILLALSLLAAGCQQATGDGVRGGPPPPAATSTIEVAQSVDMTSVNELLTIATPLHTSLHYYVLFMPLLAEQPDYAEGPTSWKPRLAKSWHFSEDRKQLTLELHRDAVWSDGVPITAEDVRWTWQAQTHPAVEWSSAVVKERIIDVEVVDPHTVRYHFDRAYAAQLFDVGSSGVILPKHAWSRLPFEEWHDNPQWFVDNLVVSGPFTLERWVPQQRIVLRRNERYFAEPPSYERLVIRIVPDESTQMALLRRGDLNLIEPGPAEAIQLRQEPEIEVESYPHRQTVFVVWNHLRPPFDDVRVRRALTMAIDRQEIIDTFYHGYALPTASWYNVESWVYDRELEPLPYDPEAAQTLLAEAGFADRDGDGILERDGKPFRFQLLTNGDNQIRLDMMVIIQEQLGRLGIAIEPIPLEFTTLLEREGAHDFDASIAAVGIDTSLDLSSIAHSAAADGEFNWMSYSNPEVDRLIDEIKVSTDQAASLPLYHRLQRLLHEDQPVTLLYQPLRFIAYRGVDNIQPNAISTFFNVASWRLEDE